MGGIVSSSGEEKRSSSVGMSPTTSIFSASAIYMQHKLSQSGWRRIGKETGWLKEAGNKLGDLIEAKIGWARTTKDDKYGRMLVEIYSDSSSASLNSLMINEGYAWGYMGETKAKDFTLLDQVRIEAKNKKERWGES